jgi:membrane protein YqaA with SNARE-associated domain
VSTLPIGLAIVLSLIAAIGLGAVMLGVGDHAPALPYLGLFVTSMVAGTTLPFLPASSEMAMASMIATGAGIPVLLLGSALIGNIIGASANYLVGSNIAFYEGRRWFPISPLALQKTRLWFARYGIWLILMCWLPMAGDAITVVAGLLRADFRIFLIFTAAGKTFGHVAVASGIGWMS